MLYSLQRLLISRHAALVNQENPRSSFIWTDFAGSVIERSTAIKCFLHCVRFYAGGNWRLRDQLKKTELLLKDADPQAREAASDEEEADDGLLAMMDEMGIEASQKKQFEKRFEEIMRKQTEMDQLREELQARRQLSAKLHEQLTELHAELGV